MRFGDVAVVVEEEEVAVEDKEAHNRQDEAWNRRRNPEIPGVGVRRGLYHRPRERD